MHCFWRPAARAFESVTEIHMPQWQRLGCSVVLSVTLAAHAAGDPKRGAQVFRQCMACHSVAAGEQMTGPSLAHLWHRQAGSVEGFLRYSDPMKRAELDSNEAYTDQWLRNPSPVLP